MKKNYFKQNQKGTTLIEIILYIALLSIISLVVIDLLISSGSLQLETEEQSNQQQNAAYISQRLTNEIRQADSVLNPLTVGQTSTSLSLINNSETHSFSLNSTNLEYQKTIGTSTTTADLNNSEVAVSNFLIQRLGFVAGKNSFKINFTLTNIKSGQQGTLEKNYEIITTLR